jgi:tagatose 1,6-diphosphate aldolase
LLSAGISYDIFLKQVRTACEAGASGVMAGRAVWREAVTLDRLVRNTFLQSVARERMQRLQSLCEALGRPFTAVYDPPELTYDWYV